MNKKTLSLIGLIGGMILIILGICVICGVLGGDTSTASRSYFYDSGYTSFGADFYTYVSNNAAEAASASRTIAENLDQAVTLLKNTFGTLFIAIGLFMVCHFGMVFFDQKAPAPAYAIMPQEASTLEPETASEEGELEKHQDSLDTSVITQSEFDAKQKQLLEV